MPTPTGRSTRVSLVLGTEAQPVLVRWCTWDPPWQREGHNDSYALLTPDGPVLIDPEQPAPAAEVRLWSLVGGPPVATVLTGGEHERNCYALRERFGAPVWAPAAALPERGGTLEGRPDHTYEEGAALPGNLRAIGLEGTGGGDHALSWTATTGERALFTGDVLNGSANPDHPNYPHLWHHRPGLYLGPGPRYLHDCDLERLRASLGRLLDKLRADGCDLLGGAHGEPYTAHPGAALAQLLELDWPVRIATGETVAIYTS